MIHSRDSQNLSSSLSCPFSKPGIAYSGLEKCAKTLLYSSSSVAVNSGGGLQSTGAEGTGSGTKVFCDMMVGELVKWRLGQTFCPCPDT